MSIFLDPELQEILRNQIKLDGGTNLAGQGGGGIFSLLRNQAKQKTDPTYSSGFDYARSIAGGMPMEQVIAPGVSYSPEDPMGYTQADLDLRNRFRGEGPAPVMPKAPTKGTPSAPNEGFVQMPSAPQGVAQPTKFGGIMMPPRTPGMDSYDGTSMSPIPEDFIQTIDRSRAGLLGLGFQPKQEPEPESIRPSLFDIDVQEILKDVEILKDIDTEKFEDIDLSGIDMPSIAPVFPQAPVLQQPITPAIPQVPVMPQIPAFKEPIPFVPEIQNIPMNFTGLPQMPVIPNIPVMPELPVAPQPIVPESIMPMNFTRLSDLPVSNFVQPSVDEIVRPITRQGKFLPQQRGLFSL
jgi:hypothetical protein